MFWDRPTVRQFFREQGNWPELRVRNCERRTALVADSAAPEDPAVLAEINRRRDLWLNPRQHSRPPLPLPVDVLATGAVIAAATTIADKRVWQVVLVAGLPLLFIRMCVVVRRRQRVQEALLDGLCPDCSYDCGLAGVGPPTCPECGGAWPLVPPDRTGRSRRRQAMAP